MALSTLEASRTATNDKWSDTWAIGLRTARHVALYSLIGAAVVVAISGATDPLFATRTSVAFAIVVFGPVTLKKCREDLVLGREYEPIGSAPVSLVTLFSARISVLLASILLAAVSYAWLPASLIGLKWGASLFLPVCAALCVAIVSSSVALVAAHMCAVGASSKRPARAIIFRVQVVLTISLGLFALHAFGIGSRPAVSVGTLQWLVIDPVSWYASYVQVAAGDTHPAVLAAFASSVVVSCAVVMALISPLSLRALPRLAEAYTSAADGAAATKPLRLVGWLRPHTANVWLLVVRHFQHDWRFRTGLLSLLPGVLVALAAGVFMARELGAAGGSFLGMWTISAAALTMLPVLWHYICGTDSHEAAWVFSAAPAKPGALIFAGASMLVLAWVVPYLVICAAISLAAMNVGVASALQHAVLTGLMCVLALEVLAWRSRRLPFSVTAERFGAAGAIKTASAMGAVCVGAIAEALCDEWGIGIALVMSALILATLWVNQRRRIDSRAIRISDTGSVFIQVGRS